MHEPAPIYKEGRYDYYAGRPSDLHRLSELQGWRISAGEPDVTGWPVVDSSGVQAGTVDDLLVDPGSHEVVFAVMQYADSLESGAEWTLVPLDMLDYGSREPMLVFRGAIDELRNAPKFDYTGCDVEGYRAYYDYWVRRSPIGQGMSEEPGAVVTRLVIEPYE